jgi:lipopolysaccharide export LptBFGC system permease protein LptF
MLRRKRAEGKGLTFTTIIWCGYLCGASAKLLLALAAGGELPPVFWLYVLNALTVGLNAAVYLHFKRRSERTEGARAWRARPTAA